MKADIDICAPARTDLSEKNPLEVLPHDATIVQLLTIFARGTHRGAVRHMLPLSRY